MSELKPCPFCGEVPTVDTKPWRHSRIGDIWHARIACENRHCLVGPRTTTIEAGQRADAIMRAAAQWNARAPVEDRG